ncbi:PREDICTED: LON peptidase N-terminal domain and RING finger protein 1 isoform X2 [Nelumbo nucifera]|uniref:RING-type domain-containing protein n=2 Tax=Nelumbo nucifera TaxID=4432 RepID=A0A822YKC1_NELNU|nr:PREDICTED: LON peptidase N-terminal domain and RING finger protein 1 isoform X2 [Nelumbo nucifera]DAD31346.1 TPA_asm: hypothetical protein HUJ06_010197 [Nelumbo nucifera]
MAEQSSSFSRNSTEFDDVEEFVWASEGETNMSWDRFGQVFDLMQKGNRAFREGRIEDAISYYYKAHNFKPGDPVILSNRSAAFSRMCELLKKRPASTSEYKPLNGLDPTTHAELALKDAEKVMSYRSNSPKTYFLKANALILLEQYEYARDTLLSGLQVDPLSNPLQACLRNLENMSAGLVSRKRNGKPQRTDDFDCTLCLKLLYEPITTPCGHSFCRSCLFQSMDHGNKCPMCRTVLFINPKTYSLSVTLNNIIQKNFAEEYAERKSEHENLTNLGVDLLPLFVMDVILPCQKLSLNIFEPRYRLMVRRIMEGNHRMGMAAIDSTTGAIADLACEVEITECEPLPDGRFYLELQEVASEAAEFARSWIRRAKEAARTGRRSRQIELLQAEAVPIPQDPERFSFWLVSLSSLRPSDKLELLRLRDTKERIQRGLIYLRAEEQGCRMQ